MEDIGTKTTVMTRAIHMDSVQYGNLSKLRFDAPEFMGRGTGLHEIETCAHTPLQVRPPLFENMCGERFFVKGVTGAYLGRDVFFFSKVSRATHGLTMCSHKSPPHIHNRLHTPSHTVLNEKTKQQKRSFLGHSRNFPETPTRKKTNGWKGRAPSFCQKP